MINETQQKTTRGEKMNKSNPVKRIEHILETETEIRNDFTAKEVVCFHYFNPNGLYAKAKELENQIMEMVKAKTVQPGWLIAYDFRFNYKEMLNLFQLKKPRWTNVNIWIQMFEDEIEKVNNKIREGK